MNTVLLANLIKIRWLAIAGQLITLLTVSFIFDFSLPLISCFVVISISLAINIFSSYIQKDNPTLTYKKTFMFLIFDISQLVALLYLTGGIFNPFIILILAPIIISASYLPALWTILLSLYSISLIFIINYRFYFNNFHVKSCLLSFRYAEKYYQINTPKVYLQFIFSSYLKNYQIISHIVHSPLIPHL